LFPKSNNKFKLALAQTVRHQSDHGGQSVVVWQLVQRTSLGTAWLWIHEDTTQFMKTLHSLQTSVTMYKCTVWHPTAVATAKVNYKSYTYSATPDT